MSALYFLYALGGLAVAFPLVFHLIRRMPRGNVQFSSLMFLAPSPPRLTRRSRLDNLLLLLLRGLALILLALAFMRPFWRAADDLSLSGIRGRRVAIVVDTSASMRRGNLWRQAVKRVERTLDDLEPTDDVGLFAFDRTVRPIVDFEGDAALTLDQKRALIRDELTRLAPTWSQTDLGDALVSVAESLDVANDREQSEAALQIVLISDLQHGSRVESLQGYHWPQHVQVDVHQLSPPRTTNASLTLLTSESDEEADDDTRPRVRVSNAADSTAEQFYVRWASSPDQAGNRDAAALYVPPGQSRVVRLARTAESLKAHQLSLSGDETFFDNDFYVVPIQQQHVTVAYLGDDAVSDPEGLRHYLEQAFVETAQRRVVVESPSVDDPLDPAVSRLVVVAKALDDAQLAKLQSYVRDGGTLLAVCIDRNVATSLAPLVGDVAPADAAQRSSNDRFLMFGEIDFTHPLFAPFANPRYSDFTKIHFWQRQHVVVAEDGGVHVVARFDDGSPALIERTDGQGRVLLLTSGWHPADSQLALSTKFLPLMSTLLDLAVGQRRLLPSYTVGQSVSLPIDEPAQVTTVVFKPDGTQCKLADDASRFDETDQPGIYRAHLASKSNDLGRNFEFAVNVAHAESDTAPLEIEQLEQQGVAFGTQTSQLQEYDRQRQLRDVELEQKQQLWRWLIVAALCVLILETFLAGKRSQALPEPTGEAI